MCEMCKVRGSVYRLYTLCLTLSHTHCTCEAFCIHLKTNTKKKCEHTAHPSHMQMHMCTHLAYIHRSHCIRARLPCVSLDSYRQSCCFALLFCGDSASSVFHSCFLPTNVFTALACKGPLKQVYGLIPRMCAIGLTTLQHI